MPIDKSEMRQIKMKKILFIHGFASSGNSQKAQDLHRMIGCDVIAPDLTHQPNQDITYLKELLDQHQIDMVVGSSLGGFYALLLGQTTRLKLLLINPSLTPHITLQDKIGYVESFKGQGFAWSEREVEQLEILYKTLNLKDDVQQSLMHTLQQSLVLLAQHDERLNYKEALDSLSMAHIIIDDVQDHRFADITPYAEYIKRLYKA